MINSQNKQTSGLFAQAFGLAKKLSSELQKTQVTRDDNRQNATDASSVIEGKARFKPAFEVAKYQDPQQMLRQQFPKLSHQLLGRHYSKVNNVTNLISPELGGKVSEYLFQWLNEFSSKSSLTEKILEEAGVKEVAELSSNTGRSQRLSQALIEQNKILATVEGVVTGATGVWGAAIDIPASIVLALRTIYQTGRSHGFDLTEEADQEVIAFIFKEIDLGIVAEKQALLVALKALQSMLETHDLQQFQQLLGSDNDIELVKKWLVDENGQFKWGWLNHIPHISVIGKLTPVAGAALGGFYSWKFLDDVGHKSQAVFGAARFYLNKHPEEKISSLEAYHKADTLLKKASPRLLNATDTKDSSAAPVNEVKNDVITNVDVQSKEKAAQPAQIDEKVETGIQKLADQYVTEHEHTQQKPALSDPEQSFTDEELKAAQSQDEAVTASKVDEKAQANTDQQADQASSEKQETSANSSKEASDDENKNDVITNVAIQTKEEAPTPEKVDEKVEAGIQQLADQYVTEHEHDEQQPALKAQPEEDFTEEEVPPVSKQKSMKIEPTSNKRS